ncbi:hypothetical protein [Glaciihabitans sp. dw_435]|uniref:hypothetical protein n=1 Tax=Glaciihabitans sp. dw_435 TaxID=2720081 RepID=UPI001BD1F6AF|nr:hypothetical protein [Glaciihabitans sp. dw_435]
MTVTAAAKSNLYQVILLWGGGALLILGGVITLVANRVADNAQMSADYVPALGGGYDEGEVVAAHGWTAFGLVAAVLGVIMLVALLIVRAARAR